MHLSKKILLSLTVMFTIAMASVTAFMINKHMERSSVGVDNNSSGVEIEIDDIDPFEKPSTITYEPNTISVQMGGDNINYTYTPSVNQQDTTTVAYEYAFGNTMDNVTAVNLKSIDTTGVNVSYYYSDSRLDTTESLTGETSFTLQQLTTKGSKVYIYVLVSPTDTTIPTTFTTSIVWYYGIPKQITVIDTVNNTSTTTIIVSGQDIDENALTTPTAPEGYYFDAWYTDETYTSLVTGNPLKVGSKVYARFHNMPTTTTLTYSDGGYTITASSDVPANLVIPATYNDGTNGVAQITGIAASAFAENTTIETVDIANGVTTIGKGAFTKCTNLTSVTIPGSITDIGIQAFSYCTSLTDIVIEDGAQSTGLATFGFCTSLESITIPSSVKTIGQQCFYSCSSLTDVTIENGVEVIDVGAFIYCSSLTELDIPNSVTTISHQAFDSCAITSIVIPDSVTTLGRGVFQRCTSLTEVTLPSNLETLPGWTFNECSSLETVDIPDSVTTLGRAVFQMCTSLTSMIIPDSVESMDAYTFFGCSSLTNVSLPVNLETIPSYAFCGCTNLTSVDFPKNIETFDSYAFTLCENLDFEIPSTIKYLNHSCLYQTGLTSLTLPEGLLFIGDYVFDWCVKVNQASITIPSSVVQIGGTEYVGDNEDNNIVGVAVFYHCATATITEFKVASGNTHFKVVEGVLYTKTNRYLVAYPAAKTDTTYAVLDGCELMYQSAMGRAFNVTTLVIPSSMILEYTDEYPIPSNFDRQNASPLMGATYKYTSIANFEILEENTSYKSIDGIIYTEDGTKAIAVPLRNWTIDDNGKKVLEFASTCTTIGNVFAVMAEASGDTGYVNGKPIGGCPNIIKISANITSIHDSALEYINALITQRGVTVEIDENNAYYELVDNQLVAKS